MNVVHKHPSFTQFLLCHGVAANMKMTFAPKKGGERKRKSVKPQARTCGISVSCRSSEILCAVLIAKYEQ